MPKTERAKIKDKLDKEWRIAVYNKAGNRCEYCGKQETLNAHHIFSRSNLTMRWLISNGVCVCVAHHVFGNISFHKAPIEMLEWIKEKRGKEWYDWLLRVSHTVTKYSVIELKELLEYYRKKNKENK